MGADVTVQAMHEALVRAVDERSTFTVRMTPKDGRAANLDDLVVFQRGVDRWVRATLRGMGYRLPRGWRLRVNLQTIQHADDGKNHVDLELDFAKIIAGEDEAENGR